MQQKSIGMKIKRFRERKAWTQEHLADAARISVRTVQRAEDGVMSAETLEAIAGALDEPVTSLSKLEPGYPQITPVLYYSDPKSLDWLVEVFGFVIRMKYAAPDDGRILHAELAFGDGLIMVGSPMETEKWLTPKQLDGAITQCMYVRVDDVDAHYAHAKATGAEIMSKPANAHGQRRYNVKDPEGHLWWFTQELHD